MKRVMIIIVLGALMACLVPATAQNAQENQWKTSTMQESGSAYSSNVTAVGATGVASMATTTSSTPQVTSGPRKDKIGGGEYGQSTESPIGDAVLPLLLFAAAYAAYSASRVYRRKRSV